MFWLARSYSHVSGSLITLFVQWMVRALALRAGSEVANLLGPIFLLVIAFVAVVIYVIRRRSQS